MFLCIRTADDRGLDGSISAHFGGSAYLRLLVREGQIRTVDFQGRKFYLRCHPRVENK